MKIYIAGKVTGLSNYKDLFEAAKEEVLALGHEPFSPIDLPHLHDRSWKSYMKECFALLFDCEGVYMLNNFRKSDGAIKEFNFAKDFDYTIIFQRHIRYFNANR